jgi:hypothetical protein
MAYSMAALFWCILSSCLGVSLRDALASTPHSRRHTRSRHQRVEDELWEMDDYDRLAR